jgi:hypothetical protein
MLSRNCISLGFSGIGEEWRVSVGEVLPAYIVMSAGLAHLQGDLGPALSSQADQIDPHGTVNPTNVNASSRCFLGSSRPVSSSKFLLVW